MKKRGRGVACGWYGLARTAAMDRAAVWVELDDGGLKVRLFDPAKTRAYNRVYMADRRAGKKPRKNGGAK